MTHGICNKWNIWAEFSVRVDATSLNPTLSSCGRGVSYRHFYENGLFVSVYCKNLYIYISRDSRDIRPTLSLLPISTPVVESMRSKRSVLNIKFPLIKYTEEKWRKVWVMAVLSLAKDLTNGTLYRDHVLQNHLTLFWPRCFAFCFVSQLQALPSHSFFCFNGIVMTNYLTTGQYYICTTIYTTLRTFSRWIWCACLCAWFNNDLGLINRLRDKRDWVYEHFIFTFFYLYFRVPATRIKRNIQPEN